MALPSTASLPQSASIVSRWKLNEASGTRADDVGSNDLTDNNTVASTTGQFGENAADFEATNSEYLNITDAAQSGLDLSGNYSFAVWLKVESNPGTYCVMGKASDTYRFFYRNSGGLKLETDFFNGANESQLNASQTLTAGTWFHVAYSWTVGTPTGKFYVNGSAVSTTVSPSTATSIQNTAGNFALGALDEGGVSLFYDGLMQDAILWSVALSDANVTSLYDAYFATPTNSNLLLLGVG